jgi:RNA polymerase sigma factor (sigma-70 family)
VRVNTYLRPTELHEVPSGTRLTPEQQAVVESNLGLISKCVRPGTPDYDDAYQNGVIGLARAAQKFDPSKGFAFSTYAMWWIKRSVQEWGELGHVMGPANVRRAERRGDTLPAMAALDAPVTEDGGTLGAFLPGSDDPEADALRLARTAELATLLHRACKDDIDRQVAEAMLARSPPTLAVQADRLGVTHQTIRQRRDRLVAKARHSVYRKSKPMEVEAEIPTTNGHMPHVPVEAPAAKFVCPECGRKFSRAQALGRHRNAHGVKGKTAKAPVRNPDSGRPKLDTTTIKADLYDAADDYDPWALIVGHANDDGPRAETVVLSTKEDADQVASMLAALGHKAWRFRLADGAPA